MALNKLMHPRNIYRTPPNFKQMAIDYPEFRKYVKQDITGKIKVDFKDNETLRCLTQTLLKKDFGLDINIPLDRLIPTVPLRLNYILWIEDLLSISTDKPTENIYGIDIGTGASCIYPLLGAKKNHWNWIATEIDQNSLKIAQENVERNNLQNLITLKHNTTDHLLKYIINENITYDFCMCNPPFFASINDLNPFTKSRTEHRPLPSNAQTGISCEVVCEGGEIEFVGKLIEESVDLKSQICIFTTMVGCKSSLAFLKAKLRAVDVVSFKQTEFHQGKTTRWGLSWTFQNMDLRKVPEEMVQIKKKVKAPQKFCLPKDYYNMEMIIKKCKDLFHTLQMDYETIKENKFIYALQVTAKENTWSNQRRKRREQMRKQNTSTTSNSSENKSTDGESSVVLEEMDISTEDSPHKRKRDDSDDEFYDVKKLKINDQEIFLKFNCLVRKLGDEFYLEMSFIEGTAEKDSVHQIMQYLKNNFK